MRNTEILEDGRRGVLQLEKMADEDADRKERARLKFLADRAALLKKAQTRLETADDSDEEDQKWSTNKGQSGQQSPIRCFACICP